MDTRRALDKFDQAERKAADVVEEAARYKIRQEMRDTRRIWKI